MNMQYIREQIPGFVENKYICWKRLGTKIQKGKSSTEPSETRYARKARIISFN